MTAEEAKNSPTPHKFGQFVIPTDSHIKGIGTFLKSEDEWINDFSPSGFERKYSQPYFKKETHETQNAKSQRIPR